MSSKRGTFSRLGFILAAAGSAIGLGNLWRFPYAVGDNGGGVFVLLYIFSVAVIAVPVLMAEISLGRHSGKNTVGAFLAIRPGTPWRWVGFLGVTCGFMILSYYSVVAGWTAGYFVKAVAGNFRNITPEASESLYSSFVSNPWIGIGLLAFFVLITVVIVERGVKGGIERFSKILMPMLFFIIILLAIRSLTLEGASRGVLFYLKPDFSKLNPKVVVAAMGQAFFSLSLGMGAMITYGSYMEKKDSIPRSAAWVALLDTAVALTAGFIIFPAIFSQGMDPNQGSRVMFSVLPVLFAKMPGGNVFGALYFFLLSIAALTSTISILEVPVAYFIDEKGWSRKRAAYWVGGAAFLIGVPSALSAGAVPFLTRMPWIHIGFQDLWDKIWGNYALSIGAFFIAIFVGYVWKSSNALKEITLGNERYRTGKLWALSVRIIAPLLILSILLTTFL